MTDYNKIWTDTWGDMQKFGPVHRHTRRIAFNIIDRIEFNSVLDAGCGQGYFCNSLFKRYIQKKKIKVTGVDISEVSIKQASVNYPELEFFVYDLENNFLNTKYDLIVSMDVIEHIENDDKFLFNIYNSCSKYFLVSTLTGQMRNFEKNIGHLRNYKKEELIEKLKNTGFKIKLVKQWGFPLFSPIYRNLLDNNKSQKISTGNFDFKKKILAQIMYWSFFLSVPDKGNIIFVLCEK